MFFICFMSYFCSCFILFYVLFYVLFYFISHDSLCMFYVCLKLGLDIVFSLYHHTKTFNVINCNILFYFVIGQNIKLMRYKYNRKKNENSRKDITFSQPSDLANSLQRKLAGGVDQTLYSHSPVTGPIPSGGNWQQVWTMNIPTAYCMDT